MKTLLINWPHKLVILLLFGLTYAPALYFGLESKLNNALIGDGARSLTFAWTVFLLMLVNIGHNYLTPVNLRNSKLTKFIIRLNVEYGKIFPGLFLTALIFIIQAIVINRKMLITKWGENKTVPLTAILVSFSSFIIFPAVAAIINYFLVKRFRKMFWG